MSMDPNLKMASMPNGEKVVTDANDNPITPKLMPSLIDDAVIIPSRGWGDCGPFGPRDKFRNSYVRYSTVYFKGTFDPATHVLAFEKQSYKAYSYGPGDQVPGAPPGFLADLDMCNGQKEGALSKDCQFDLYKILALGVHVDPLVRLPTDDDPEDPLGDLFVTAEEQNAPSYEAMATRLLLNHTTLSFTFDDDDCPGELGLLLHHPPPTYDVGHGQMGNVTNSNPFAGNVIPLPYPIFAGGRRNCDELEVTVDLKRAIKIKSPSPDLVPIPTPPDPLPPPVDFFLGVRIEAYGRMWYRQ